MTKQVKKIWGSEEWIVNTPEYCGKILTLKRGFRCSMHYHKNKDETFFLIDGRILLEYGSEQRVMIPGESQRIEPEVLHRFTGLDDSRIVEFSTHHEESDSYRVEGQLSGAADIDKLADLMERGILA